MILPAAVYTWSCSIQQSWQGLGAGDAVLGLPLHSEEVRSICFFF